MFIKEDIRSTINTQGRKYTVSNLATKVNIARENARLVSSQTLGNSEEHTHKYLTFKRKKKCEGQSLTFQFKVAFSYFTLGPNYSSATDNH